MVCGARARECLCGYWILHSLMSLAALAAEPWCAPADCTWLQLSSYGFGMDTRLTPCNL